MKEHKKIALLALFLLMQLHPFGWGFYAHKKINYYATFLLPPQMLGFYKANINFLSEHAVDPDKRRYAVAAEGPRHYIDIDEYGAYPYPALPHNWDSAIQKYTEDTVMQRGIVPWWIQTMHYRLTNAFKEKDEKKILKLSAEIGHYIADAHVPLHASANHNGQLTGQGGIHAFWESRVPELLSGREWDFFIGPADYIKVPADFIWKRILESAAAADTVLQVERELTAAFPAGQKYAFETRNGVMIKQYSSLFTKAYDARLKGMVERRMRQSIYAVASFWYTAWVNAGQPDLSKLSHTTLTEDYSDGVEELNQSWRNGAVKNREHETPLP